MFVVAMHSLSSSVRAHNLSKLDSEHFDVLVIGGGVTGAGVALDAAARGYRVALVEKIDFASGTSSKSTKLVHGGIRYLPNFDFSLVHEALVERGILLQNAPFLVSPVPFVLPMYKGDRHPVGMPFTTPGGIGLGLLLRMGLWMYDGLAGRYNIKRHRRLKREGVLKLAPALVSEGLKDGYMYYDAQTNDARLTMALIRTAAQQGAVITNYTEVTSFISEQGKIQGARVHDRIGNQDLLLYARHIVNAKGVFSVLPETEDKRILFIVPWESRAIFGTTDTGSGDLDHPTASREDIVYLLKYLNRYLSVTLTEDNIISSYAGYRPLVSPRKAGGSTARVSRTHAVLESPSGLVTIVGGKMTTYRRMAQDTLDVLKRRDGSPLLHPTQSLPLQGSAGWPVVQSELEKKGAMLGLSPQTLSHLGRNYGAEAVALLELIVDDPSLAQLLIDDLPYIRAEVIFACRQEMAMTPYDVLARRTSITLEDRRRGLGVVDEVAALMAKEHQWSPDQQQSLVDTFRSAIEAQIAAEKIGVGVA